MRRPRLRRVLGACVVAALVLVAIVLWQFTAFVRFGIAAAAAAVAHVRVSIAHLDVTPTSATLDGIRVTSWQGEPIATVDKVALTYDWHDLLPGGKRLYGLKSASVYRPNLTVIRHTDGTFNVPVLRLPSANGGVGKPLRTRLRIIGGTADLIDGSRNAVPGLRNLYLRGLHFDADIASDDRSNYVAGFEYGENRSQLYPVRGRGTIDVHNGYMDQHWMADAIPVAGAVNFLVDSASLRMRGGELRDVDARYFALRSAGGTLHPHLAATAFLNRGRIGVAGLAAPVERIVGSVNVYDDGLVTPQLDAFLRGVPVHVSGGIYNLHDPRVRIAVAGSGKLSRLRTAFVAARRLPIEGVLRFAVLIEGKTSRPTTWIDFRSPAIAYASTKVDRVTALVGLSESEADVVHLHASYNGTDLDAAGRATLRKSAESAPMLVAVRSPSGAIPFAGSLLPGMPMQATALASASDPKAFGVRGVLVGTSATQRLAGLFDVDERGVGTVGPIRLDSKRGGFYARIALDRPNSVALGVVAARGLFVPQAHAALDADLFGGRDASGVAASGSVNLRGVWGSALAEGGGRMQRGALAGAVTGNVNGQASFAASLTGKPSSPRLAGTVVVANGRYRNFDVNGNAGILYADGTLRVRDAAVALGPVFVGLAGTVAGLYPNGTFAPSYDLAAQVHTSDVAGVLAAVQPRAREPIAGSLDADVRIRGTAATPRFEGTISAPEGSVNGLAFREMNGTLRGGRSSLALSNGRVLVGSTTLSLNAAVTPGTAQVAVDTPHTELSDFNDFFDTGDMFGGSGSLAMNATLAGTQIVATTGRANFSHARYRQLELGTVAARWENAGSSVRTNLRMGGASGQLAVSGNVAPATRDVDLRATARGVDLGTWLPMLGMQQPITGKLDAQTSLNGRYPDIAMALHAAVRDGTVGRLPLSRFDVTASMNHGRGRIDSAAMDLPSLSTTASGTFGLRTSDPIALVAHSTSPNVGAFMVAATGKDLHLGGRLDSTLRLEGTPLAPRLDDRIVLQALHYGNLIVPRVSGDLIVQRRAIALRGGEVDLERGRALISAAIPVQMTSSGVRPGQGPIAASVTADDVELANFASLLPKNSRLAGRIDGQVAAGGTVASPQLNGSMRLRDGTVSTSLLKSSLDGIEGVLAFQGRRAQLQSQAKAGGGTLDVDATASLENLLRPAGSTIAAQLHANNARLDLSPYFRGDLNGTVALQRAPGAAPVLSGDATLSNARISLAAFLAGSRGGGGSALPNVAFQNVRLAAGHDVRIQSANVDVGTAGAVTLAGTLQSPTLAGSFRSTGGSLSFYRSFNLENAAVRFSPSSGLIPDVNAVATTFVTDPATAIRLHVTGPATNMHLALESQPEYSRQQILGILVGAQQFGAVQGVRSTGGGVSASSAATNLALGQADTYFTRSFLEPLSGSTASALGLSSVQLTAGVQSGVGVSAVKAFGKTVSAIFNETFGYPKTQSIALEAHPSVATGLRLTAYTSQGPTLFSLQQPQPVGYSVLNLNPMTSFTPASGANGVSFAFQKKFP
jgi:autotransporter translocation and assembly factor TamB